MLATKGVDPEIKIIDFGLSKIMRSSNEEDQQFVGTRVSGGLNRLLYHTLCHKQAFGKRIYYCRWGFCVARQPKRVVFLRQKQASHARRSFPLKISMIRDCTAGPLSFQANSG